MTNANDKPRMVSLTINGDEVEAEEGRLVIDVAEELGVFVPRFCYHPGMASVAVCRMCLVRVEGMPKLVPACATPVQSDMVVDTVEEEAVGAQKDMLEFLLINHPLDCPICDRAGECPLQDQTYRHGPGSSRYTEEKRTYEKALEISELVVLDRERCVLCWRCVRFSDEIAGDRFIQLVDRGDGTQILNFEGDPFDSYFSGNTIQICPVGALTSKPYRFVARPWDLETAPSVCSYCSVGCPITNEARRGQLVRCQALPNEQVNDFWICDKGRFGYHHVSSEDRLETPLIRSDDSFQATSWSVAAERAAEALKDKRVGVIAGGHLTTEDAYAIAKLAKKTLGTRDVDSRIQDAGAPYEMLAERLGVVGSTASIADLQDADTVVWVGADPKENLPVLYLHLHTGCRDRGTRLVVASSRHTSLHGLGAEAVQLLPGRETQAIADLASELEGNVVVCWAPASPGRSEKPVIEGVLQLVAATGGKLLVGVPHAGSQGMLDMGVHPGLDAGYKVSEEAGRDTRAILEAAAAGELDTLILYGADPIADFPDGNLARRALEGGVTVIAVELFPTDSAMLADILFPSAAYAEREGTFTNLERRLQKLEALTAPPGTAREPWQACLVMAEALGDRWGWRTVDDIWGEIRKEVSTHKDVDIARLAQERSLPQPWDTTGFAPDNTEHPLQIAGPGGQYPKGHRQGAPFQTGQNWPLSWELRAFEAKQRPGIIPFSPEAEGAPAKTDPSPSRSSDQTPAEQTPAPAEASSEGTVSSAPGPGAEGPGAPGRARNSEDARPAFVLLSGRFIYDEGAMVARSKHLRALQRGAFVEMNDEDAKALGVADGDMVVVEGAGDSVTLPARVNGIAKGCVFVPYDQKDLRANTLMTGEDPTVTIARAEG